MRWYPLPTSPMGYPMALLVDANIIMELLDIDLEELLAEVKNDRQKDKQIRLG